MSTGADVVSAARRVLGLPYQWGSADPSRGGLDCSGLVDYVYKAAGHPFKGRPVASQLGRMGTAVSAADAAPGDVVYYDEPGPIDHVGIYIGGGQMIDAPYSGTTVRVDNIGRPTSIRHILGGGSGGGWLGTAIGTGIGWGVGGQTGDPVGGAQTGAAAGSAVDSVAGLFANWQNNLLGIGVTIVGAVGAVALVVTGARQTVERT